MLQQLIQYFQRFVGTMVIKVVDTDIANFVLQHLPGGYYRIHPLALQFKGQPLTVPQNRDQDFRALFTLNDLNGVHRIHTGNSLAVGFDQNITRQNARFFRAAALLHRQNIIAGTVLPPEDSNAYAYIGVGLFVLISSIVLSGDIITPAIAQSIHHCLGGCIFNGGGVHFTHEAAADHPLQLRQFCVLPAKEKCSAGCQCRHQHIGSGAQQDLFPVFSPIH